MNSPASWLAARRAYAVLAGMVVVGMPLFALALLASRIPGRRRSADVLLKIVATGLVVSFAPEMRQERQADWRKRTHDARTMHLAEPQVVAGVESPTGSTAYLNGDGGIDGGTLAVPTPVDGLPLIDGFESGAATLDGTHAAPAEVASVPCAAGAVT